MSFLEENKEAWHSERATGIGGSELAIILGLSPYKTAYRLWAERCGFVEKDETNFVQARGQEWEPAIRAMIEEELREHFPPANVKHPIKRYVRASLDGMSTIRILEIKLVGKEMLQQVQAGELPELYRPQVHYNMFAAGRGECVFAVYNEKLDQKAHLIVKRDDAYIETLDKAAFDFYQKIQNREAPELTERDYVECDEDAFLTDAAEYTKIKAEIAKHEKKLKEVEERIKARVPEGAPALKGGGIMVSGHARKGSVQLDLIPQLKGVDLDQFRKGATWVTQIRVSKKR